MFIMQMDLLAFAQHVTTTTQLPVQVSRHEPYLAEVPEDFYLIGSDAAVGQDAYLWGDESGAVLYLVLPGLGIFAADWTDAADQVAYHPGLGCVAAA